MKRTIQIVAYRIAPEHLGTFHELKSTLIEEAHELDGLLSSTTLSDNEDPCGFLDLMVWRDAEAGQRAQATFEALPSTPKFLSMFAGPPTMVATYEADAGDLALEFGA